MAILRAGDRQCARSHPLRGFVLAKVDHFDSTAVVLHWTTAGLIVIAFGLGLAVDAFPKDWEHAVVNTHSLLGLGVLALTAVRIAWRLGHAPPPLPEEFGGPLVRRAAAIVHFLLYALMVAVPLIGIPVLLYRGRGLDFGLFQLPSPFTRTPEIFRPLQETHELAAYALIGLAAAHMLAALYHHFIRRDEVLLQMLIPTRR
jgi:cytochrome b561